MGNTGINVPKTEVELVSVRTNTVRLFFHSLSCG